MRNWRSIEMHTEKSQREFDIRQGLREWDEEFPYVHHELIIRYAAGLIAHTAVCAICDWINQRSQSRKRSLSRY